MLDFDTVYREYAPRIRRFVLFLSGDAAVADDVTAETFVRVWATRDRVRRATLRAFLFAIARNLFLQSVRGGRRQELVDQVDPAPGPEAQVIGRLDLERVHAALARLDTEDRAAILLRAQEDLPYEEIAQTLGISAGAAKVRVHRARRRLATLLDRRLP